MPKDFEELKRQLLKSETIRNLATQHHDLDERTDLTTRHYLSEPEQVEEVG